MALSELADRSHAIKPHQFLNRGHLLISIHSGNRRDAVIANVKSQKVARGYITLKNDLIPAGGVTDVQETGIELSCPEKRHTVIRDLFASHVVRRNATLLQCRTPMLYPLAFASKPRRKVGDI